MAEPTDPALSELLARMHWVRGLAGALVRDADRADDLAQDAWVRALRAGPAQSASWRGWFARVMKNRVTDEGRLQGQHARFEARQPRTGGGPSEQEILQQMETHTALSEALRALPDPYRRAVFLHYFEGWSLSRIAAEDECDKRAIEKRLRQARAMMRTHLERRAPAEHWAVGLLLLATPSVKSGSLIAAGILVAVALLAPTAWLLRPEPPEAIPTLKEVSVSLEESDPASAAESATAQATEEPYPTPGLVRSVAEIALPSFELAFMLFDAKTKASIPEAFVSAACRDAYGSVLETRGGKTNADGMLVLTFTAQSGEALVTIAPDGGKYESMRSISYTWESTRDRVEFKVPLNPYEGSFRGIVLDEFGAPVPGAFVDLWKAGDERKSLHPEASVQAGRDGRFEMVTARRKDERLTMTPRASGQHSVRGFELDRRLPVEALVEGVELILGQGRQFTVEVVDEQQQPIEGARVSIWPSFGTDRFEQRGGGEYSGRIHYMLVTDSNGKSPPVMIGNEQWQVHVDHAAYTKWDTGRSAPEGESMLVVLASGRTIRGILQSEDGSPASGVDIIVESASGTEKTRSGAQGAFLTRIPGAPGEEIRILCISKKRFAFHVVGPLVPESLTAPLIITLSPGLNLSFDLVYPDGSPYDRMHDIQWEVLNGPMARQPGGDESSAQSWLKLRPVNENDFFSEVGFMASGFHFFQCPPGTYRLRLTNSQGVIAEADIAAGVKGQKIVIDGVSISHGVFAGQVTRASTNSPLVRYEVMGTLYGGQEDNAKVLGRLGDTVQDSDGRFRFEKLAPGWYEFDIEATPDLTHWRSGRIWIETPGDPWTVKLDEVIAGELIFQYPDGMPAAECDVQFVDERNIALPFAQSAGAGHRLSDRTDGAGRLRIAQLPRFLPFQIWVTPPNRPTRVVPAGALDPALTEWRVTLPD